MTILTTTALNASEIKSDEAITYFPTNGYYNERSAEWRIPIHGWIYEAEYDSLWRNGAMALLKLRLGLEDGMDGSEHLKARGWPFIVDNERGKALSIAFSDTSLTLHPSEANGHFHGEVTLQEKGMLQLDLEPWIAFTTVMPEGDNRSFTASVQLLSPTGLSVISDIDDTIKHSHVLDHEELLKNTFIRDFKAVPGMSQQYRKWQQQEAAFHYVTGSPWQLYPALSDFVVQHDFPRGSFMMRELRIKDRSLIDFLGSSFDYKVSAISELLQRYPLRHFILVGDSGERDPEIYSEIAKRYPKQIRAIYIRNVTDEKASDERFKQLFTELPDTRWKLFNRAEELE
ncbi:MAG: DUF2183 domain-containing protein [Chromatiales bacterium]|nr:DUF2183 domain-containing protein [Chromatiales bacterium]